MSAPAPWSLGGQPPSPPKPATAPEDEKTPRKRGPKPQPKK